MAKRIKVIRLVPYAGASALKRLKHFVELMLQDRRLYLGSQYSCNNANVNMLVDLPTFVVQFYRIG